MHPPSYTEEVLATIARDEVLSRCTRVVNSPHPPWAVLSAFALRQAVEEACPPSATVPLGLIIWAFSAGCVGAAALATYWQQHRGPVLALFMVDGWGVPSPLTVPVYRLSHDRMTHETSRLLGAGTVNFYADPAIPHLDLWRHPQSAAGWAVEGIKPAAQSTAADFLCRRSRDCLTRHGLNINGP